MSKPKRNAALLRKVGRFIEEHPHRYVQGAWHCGSKMCVAGTAALLCDRFVGWDREDEDVACVRISKETVGREDVSDLAREELGLSFDEADTLFGPDWEPVGEGRLATRVKKALYALARGADVMDVTDSQV